MTPESESPSEDRFTELEQLLLDSSLDGVLHMLQRSGHKSWRTSGYNTEQALRCFDAGDPDWVIVSQMASIEQPQVAALCMYEIEQRDLKRGQEMLDPVRDSFETPVQRMEFMAFLAVLREHGEGSDGGAGVREPHPPEDPQPGGAIALEVPRDETLTEPEDGGGSVALLEHPDDLDPDEDGIARP
jgi:hypothetical protein